MEVLLSLIHIYNTGFNASGYNNNYNSQNNCQMPPKQMDLSPLSTGEWLLTMIVGIIPCAGLILYIILSLIHI